MLPRVLLIALALSCPPTLLAGEDEPPRVHVSGVVVDDGGKPVADARVSPRWTLTAEACEPTEPLTVDTAGRFTGDVVALQDHFVLGAYTPDGELAGWVPVSKDAATDLEITLAPSVRVTCEVTCSELGRAPRELGIDWSYGGQGLAGSSSTTGRLEARLPRGLCSWSLYDEEFTSRSGEVSLNGTAAQVDLGTIDLPASFIARHEGQPLPPWTVTEARGVAVEDAQLEHYRGKWVLIEFWGFW